MSQLPETSRMKSLRSRRIARRILPTPLDNRHLPRESVRVVRNCRNQAFALKIPLNERYRDFRQLTIELPPVLRSTYSEVIQSFVATSLLTEAIP